MEFIHKSAVTSLSNPGVISRQLLNPDNSSSTRVTITEVHLEPGACQPRHVHDRSEQIWYALQGSGKLLLESGTEMQFNAGDVVRFGDGDIHGLQNDVQEKFVYLSVTAPPIHFGYAYQDKNNEEGD
ncbi:MAG: cupin domain-containing protein [Acutalibacter muris]|nr:cupin domain-containing protein [Acutalibacter muris]